MIIEKIKKHLLKHDSSIDTGEIFKHIQLEDNSDGNGAYIASWDENKIGISEPTSSEISDISDNSIRLERAVELKKAEINFQREEVKNSLTSFTRDGKDYFFDRGILSRQPMAMAAITLGGNDTIDWITDDNSIVILTNQEILAICSHITSTDTREIKLARLRKNEVIALGEIKEGDSVEERIAEVENYDITKVFTD